MRPWRTARLSCRFVEVMEDLGVEMGDLDPLESSLAGSKSDPRINSSAGSVIRETKVGLDGRGEVAKKRRR